MNVNKQGYLVIYRVAEDGPRTYVCADRASVNTLIERLAGRAVDTFTIDSRGLPKLSGLTITEGLHIYSSGD